MKTEPKSTKPTKPIDFTKCVKCKCRLLVFEEDAYRAMDDYNKATAVLYAEVDQRAKSKWGEVVTPRIVPTCVNCIVKGVKETQKKYKRLKPIDINKPWREFIQAMQHKLSYLYKNVSCALEAQKKGKYTASAQRAMRKLAGKDAPAVEAVLDVLYSLYLGTKSTPTRLLPRGALGAVQR